jgi:hypothetical protein
MKSINYFSRLFLNMVSLAGIIVMAMGTTVYALHVTKMPKDLQTKVLEPQMRQISLKLPLQQPAFHWTFMSKEKYLEGQLVLRIKRGDKTTEITIFKDGKLTQGWKPMAMPQNPKAGEIYFGFQSSTKYATAPNDTLEIELHVNKDLNGIGAIHTGILPKGIYKTQGTYSGLIDKYKVPETFKDVPKETLDKLAKMYEFKAFLESWKQQWKLNITGDDGWLPPEQRQAFEQMMKQMRQEEDANKNKKTS